MSSAEPLSYRSPVTKLLRFFCRSRDQWKDKCKTAKRENKSLKTRLAKMKESRDRWKAEARGMREKLRAEACSVEEPAKNGEARRAHSGRPARRIA
jgi:F0F1-type ATP synthase membrane subunit b/b'